MDSVHLKPTKDELNAYARVLAQKLVASELPETLAPITTYGLIVLSGAYSRQTYIDFQRCYHHVTKPGFGAVTIKFGGDPDLFEYLEDQLAVHVYELLKPQVEG